MTAVRLAWHLLRAGGRRGATTMALSLIGTAVVTLLLVVIAGTWSGFDARADRAQWRTPRAADTATATAVQRTMTSAYDAAELVVIDLAATGHGAPAPPPGLAAFPRPGQVFLSPALAALVAEHPADLGRRFPEVSGELGERALQHPDELVAVIAHVPGDPTMSAPGWSDQRRPQAYAGPVAITGFAGRPVVEGQAAQYRSLASVAAVLLLVPLLVLAGAAARLGLARRDQRLAALRLAGATPRQVVVMTAVESGLVAAAGAVTGIAGAFLVIPALARVPVDGGSWYAADLVPPGPALLALVIGVIALAVASSVVALRRVLSSPLGVAAAHTPRAMSPTRVLVLAALLVGFLRYSRSAEASTSVLVLVFAAVFGALTVIGPWVVGVLGQVVLHRSRTTASLLAARRMLDDPRGTWRVVGSVAMTGFVAGTLALFPTGGTDLVWGAADRIDVAVSRAAAGEVATELRTELATAGLAADVAGPGTPRGALLFLRTKGSDVSFLSITVPDPGADLEAVRSVVAEVAPGSVAATGTDIMLGDDRFTADFRTASVVVLALSFLIAMTSAGITAAAGVLDRRRTYRQLALIGVPLPVLDRARALETQLPLLLLAVGSSLVGVVVAAPITGFGMGGGGLDLRGVGLLVACLGSGLLGVRLATAASRPLLARVAADPASTSL